MRNVIVTSILLVIVVLGCQFHLVSADENCSPAGGFQFICGPSAVEDLVAVPGTQWIIGSGMVQGKTAGKLHLIDAGKKTWEVLYPSPSSHNVLDTNSFPSCPDAPDPDTFGAHGIAISRDGSRNPLVLAVNHGREAIEVFRLNTAGTRPAIRWVGCVPMGERNFINSVVVLPDGGFAATKFYDPKAPGGFGSIFAGGTTGGILEWHRKSGVKPLAGTDVAGANGIEVSKDGKVIYVSAWGSQEVVRFSHGKGSLKKDVVKIGFCPDNLRWAPDGKLLIAGQNTMPGGQGGFPRFKGWTVVKLDPETLKFAEIAKEDGKLPQFQNISAALEFDKLLWLGQFSGNRIGYTPLK